MIPGLMVFDARAALTPADSLGHDPQGISPLGQLVGVQRVLDYSGVQHRQLEQFLDRRRGERVVLLGR